MCVSVKVEIRPMPPPLVPNRPAFLNAGAGAISAPLNVLNRNTGQDEAFIRKPERKRNSITNYREMSYSYKSPPLYGSIKRDGYQI